jgi:hypothetical protein
MAEQWLSIVEYARATGISDMTIRRRIRCGRIKAELRDGKYYIPVAAAANSAQSNAATSPLGAPQIVKHRPVASANHEQAFQTRSIPTVRPAQVPRSVVSNNISTQGSDVPHALSQPLVEAGLASVEARALIEFCDHALEQARSTVTAVEHKYRAHIEALNAQLGSKNHEIKALNQQIEDLQLLVQILERKKIP